MVVVPAAEPETFTLEGNHMVGLATPRRGTAEVEVWRAVVDAGSATPLHRHDREEVVVVLRGHGRARVGDREVQWSAGDTLILPAGEVHQLFADTAGEYIAVMPSTSTISTPAGDVMELPWRR